MPSFWLGLPCWTPRILELKTTVWTTRVRISLQVTKLVVDRVKTETQILQFLVGFSFCHTRPPSQVFFISWYYECHHSLINIKDVLQWQVENVRTICFRTWSKIREKYQPSFHFTDEAREGHRNGPAQLDHASPASQLTSLFYTEMPTLIIAS